MITSQWTSSRNFMKEEWSSLVIGVFDRKWKLQLKWVHQFLQERLGDKWRIEYRDVLKTKVKRRQVKMKQRKQRN
jgi:hypothetical protein